MKRNQFLVLLPLLLVVLLCSTSISNVNAHNITRILAEHPEFSTFNHYLTATHLASEINRRLTITVLALDNSAMSTLLAKHFSLPTLKNVLSLHILVDYYGAKKLHQLTGGTALSSSFFQSTGAAPGTTGFVNITDHSKGHVSFAAEDDSGDSTTGTPASFVKAIKEMPYNISVVQISAPLSNPEAEAPAAAPAPVNLTVVLSKSGCKAFADLLSATADVLKTYEGNIDGGLTVFCPVDAAVKAFMPKFKNLTDDDKASLLLFHGEAVYNSMQMLKQNNGLSTTLATEGTKKNYHFTVQNDGEKVTLETKINTATILKTLLDQDSVAIYSIDKVLEPKDLFKKPEEDADAPAPAPKAAGKKKKKKGADAEAPAPASDEAPADVKAADENAADGKDRWAAAAVVAATIATIAVIV